MLLHLPIYTPPNLSSSLISSCYRKPQPFTPKICKNTILNQKPRWIQPIQMLVSTFLVAATTFSIISSAVPAAAHAQLQQKQKTEQEYSGGGDETLSNIPQTLSSECEAGKEKDCNKKARIQRPKSRKAESCTIKCVTTCIRGGLGSPGEGPLNVRRPLVVFKQGFRSRLYCLTECSDICNLIGDGDDGP